MGQSNSVFHAYERFSKRALRRKTEGNVRSERPRHRKSESDAGRGARRAGDGGEGVGSCARARLPYRPGRTCLVNFCPLVGPSMTSMVNTGLGAAGALRLRVSLPAGIVPNLGRRFRDSRGDGGS